MLCGLEASRRLHESLKRTGGLSARVLWGPLTLAPPSSFLTQGHWTQSPSLGNSFLSVFRAPRSLPCSPEEPSIVNQHLRAGNSEVERSVLGGSRRFLLGPGHRRPSRMHSELPLPFLSPEHLDLARTGRDGMEGQSRQTSSGLGGQ